MIEIKFFKPEQFDEIKAEWEELQTGKDMTVFQQRVWYDGLNRQYLAGCFKSSEKAVYAVAYRDGAAAMIAPVHVKKHGFEYRTELADIEGNPSRVYALKIQSEVVRDPLEIVINDKISYIEATDDPLSADIGIIRDSGRTWLFDVGADRRVLEHLPVVQEDGYEMGFDFGKCRHCNQCVTACAYAARSFDEGGYAQVDESLCRHCGLCVSVCNFGALSVVQGAIR